MFYDLSLNVYYYCSAFSSMICHRNCIIVCRLKNKLKPFTAEKCTYFPISISL